MNSFPQAARISSRNQGIKMAIEIALEPRRFMRIGTLEGYTAWYQKYTFPRSTSCVLELF